MLRRDLVDRLDRFVHGVRHEDEAEAVQGPADDLRSGEELQIPLDLIYHVLRELRARGHQHRGGHLVVLRLGQQVRCHIVRIRSLIGQDRDL